MSKIATEIPDLKGTSQLSFFFFGIDTKQLLRYDQYKKLMDSIRGYSQSRRNLRHIIDTRRITLAFQRIHIIHIPCQGHVT
jgi:hypothetical protein